MELDKMELEMDLMTCAGCHVPFAITKAHALKLRTGGKTFYCPNGHGNCFNGGVSKEKAKLIELEKEVAYLRMEAANKRKTTKKQKG